MKLAAAAAVALVLFGCEKSKPKQDRVEPEAARPKQEPKVETAEAVVVFTSDGDFLFPAVCWDKKKDVIAGGAECIGLAKPGATIQIAPEKSVVAGPVKNWECEGDMSDFDGYSVPENALDGAEDFAVYPVNARTGWKPATEMPDAEVGIAVSKAVQTQIEKAVAGDLKSKPSADVVVLAYDDMDVDGDGKQDKFYTAVVQPEDREPEYEWSGLLLEYGSDPGNYVVLFTHDMETMTVDGSFDLNGDGKRELYVTTAYYEGNYTHYAQLEGAKLTLTVVHGCGA